jgi:murein L,D-transpeptidase YcbB/YkuD
MKPKSANLVAARVAMLAWLLLAPPPVQAQGIVAPAVSRLYSLDRDSLLWHRDGLLTPAGHSAVRLLAAARDQGLDPAVYDARLLDSLARAGATSAADRRRLDLLLSVDVVRYLAHLHGGRTAGDPREEIVTALGEAIAADALPGLAAALEPRLAQYRLLRRSLAEYRLLAEDTTLVALPERRTVRPGEPYEALAALARYLTAVGDLPPELPLRDGDTYQQPIADAVRRFQERHGLTPDGVLGPATVRALNTPIRQRVRQLELAMERLRRLPPIPGERLLVVNVPAFRLFAFDSATSVGAPALSSRVVVGRAVDTRTPVLFEPMRVVEFWPYWNVPRSILLNEVLPALRRSPEYLRRNGMEVVDRQGRILGASVTPAIHAGLLRGAYRVRQRPGPDNALGLVKLVFPNAASIYLHGTPHPGLFERTRRDLSHGCIRVEDIRGLVTWVLQGSGSWTGDSTEAALRAGRSRRVALSDPLPVVVFYTTAAAAPDGRTFFYEDLYGLDRRLDAELRGPSHIP